MEVIAASGLAEAPQEGDACLLRLSAAEAAIPWMSPFALDVRQGDGTVDGGGALNIMHGRSRMTIDPRIPTMPGLSTSGFHRPGRQEGSYRKIRHFLVGGHSCYGCEYMSVYSCSAATVLQYRVGRSGGSIERTDTLYTLLSTDEYRKTVDFDKIPIYKRQK